MHPLTLAFRSPGLEGQYLADVANRRWPVYIFIFCFDVACYSFRLTAKRLRSNATSATVLTEVAPQLANMAMLYIFLGLLNGRSRRMGARAARQEEYLLITVMAFAICCLLTTLRAENAQDYVFGGYFLICTTSFLKIRWLVGTTVLAAPIALVHFWYRRFTILPVDAEVHLLVAWAVGGLMSFLADTYRRQMFANHKLAATAAEKEIHEARARAEAQRLLAGAQAQAAQRALIVAREKAANEAKSEFMSLMCHEVRTPLNGCLASAEMLLETPLEEEQRELAKTIRVSGSILLSTVSNFLDFFKMEAGKQLDVVRTEIDVQELVSDVHCIIEAMIGRGCGVTLMRPHMPGVPEYALGDPDRLRGILLNLYTNAAKFTKRGAISLRVSVAGPNFRPKPHELHTFSATSSRRSTDEGSIRLSSTSGAERSTAEGVARRHQTRPSDSGDNADLGVAPTSIASGGQSPAASGVDPSASCGPGSVSTSDATRSSSLEAPTTPETSASPARVQPVLTSDGERTAAASSSGQDSGPGAESSSIGSDSDQYGDQADQARRDSHIEASTSGRSAGNTGRRSSGGSRVQPQMKSVERLGNGWCSVVSANPAATQAGHDLSNHQQWLVFEVADMGVGIAEEGLQRLFREYVQGTEDEMRQPRRRGGTGLGLSICSKQVAVLGGQIGAMSKRDCGSTFWFTIPLIMPAPSERGRTSEMRRVASWCSRDAFSDGHLRAPEPHEAEARLKGATSRAHSFRKYHHSQRATRSTSYVSVTEAQRAFAQEDAQASVQNSLLYSNRGASSHQSEPASRRRSAPQEDRVIDPGFLPDVAVAVAAAQRVERLAQPVSAADKRMGTPQAGTPAAKSAAARAALLSAPAPAPTTEAASMRNPAATPPLSRRSSLQSLSRRGSLSEAQAFSLAHSAASVVQAAQAKLAAIEQQSGPPCSGEDSSASEAEARRPRQSFGAPPRRPSHHHLAKALGPVPEMTTIQMPLLGVDAAPPPPALQIKRGKRPSMEARRRKLDISALQGRRVLLAEDNLINQTVARKMLTSLGMHCEVASNGQEAVDIAYRSHAEGNCFSIILMDMAMPVMGGCDATRMLRRLGLDLPIVAMTANASDRDRDECLEAGMDGFLSKPVLKDRLAEAIMQVISGRARYKDEALALKALEGVGG
ncbi:hypothetical protein WJX72_001151 [[Myrmecia] bisecta]|uniref:histidine kinase n=1 Tax=[Myrmecia] bisecta TaxID=41462 RepID=A0AAW1PNX5_9CHLO